MARKGYEDCKECPANSSCAFADAPPDECCDVYTRGSDCWAGFVPCCRYEFCTDKYKSAHPSRESR